MKEIKINGTTEDGQEIEYMVEYPTSSEEIKYRYYLGYLEANGKCNKAIEEQKPFSELAYYRSEALSEICPQVKDMSFNNPELAFQALTLINDQVSKAFTEFEKPTNGIEYSIEWQGQKYTLNKWRAEKAMHIRQVSTFEAVEYMEMNRIYEKDLEEYKKKSGEHNYGKQFVLSTQSVAMLLRKPNEELPRAPEPLKQWLLERCKVFNDLPLSVHNATAFFLAIIYNEYNQTLNTNMLSSHLRASAAAVKKAPNKSGSKRKRKALRKV